MKAGKQNILIIGDGAAAEALAKKLCSYDFVGKVFVASGNGIQSDCYENIDIREDDSTSLLKFVIENNVDLTIPISKNSLKSDIVSFFQANGQNIFGPDKKAALFTLNKITAKKFLYKLRAKTQKFGIFDKVQTAMEYLKTSNFPVVINSIENNLQVVCPTLSIANKFLTETINFYSETDILIQDYIYGHRFTVYYITDGYSAIPFSTVGENSFVGDDNIRKGHNVIENYNYTPDYKVSKEVISEINNVVKNLLKNLENKGYSYIGVLGAECVISNENELYITGFRPFFEDNDAGIILNSVEDNLIKIFNSCINGFFSDEYEGIKTNNLYSISAVFVSLQDAKVIKGLENTDGCFDFINVKYLQGNYYTSSGDVFTIYNCAKTLSLAKQKLEEDINIISFE